MGLPCALCGSPIDYTLPYYVIDENGRKRVNMLAFVIDEKIPISKWQQGGYKSPADCANDYNNLQPAHAICNAREGNKESIHITAGRLPEPKIKQKKIKLDGSW